MTESAFLTQVLALARLRNWRCLHLRPARTAKGWRTAVQGDGVGFPDLLLVRPPRLLVAELKSATGRLTGEQAAWLFAFQQAGIKTYVWRPGDWPEIERTLE